MHYQAGRRIKLTMSILLRELLCVLELLQEVIRRLVAKANVKVIILFGSRVRGD